MKNDLVAQRHWKWGTNALTAANRDIANRDPQNAVSRAYYAMMHAANAALAMKGLQSRSHKQTQTLFNMHLVQPGEVDKQRGRDLASGQRKRSRADYDVSTDVSQREGQEQCKRATTFLSEIRTHLRTAGLREDALAAVPLEKEEQTDPMKRRDERPAGQRETSGAAGEGTVAIGTEAAAPATAPAPAEGAARTQKETQERSGPEH